MLAVRYFIGFIFIALTSFSYAQKPRLIFHQLSLHDGLSENSIRCVIEDKAGFMWFGSEDGLNKYDGYKFTIYKKNPADPNSISSSEIKGFYLDSKNNFWISTRNGINIYDPVTDVFYNFRNKQYPALKSISGDVEAITEDSKGRIWVAVADEGLFMIESLLATPKKYNYISENNDRLFYSVLEDSDTSLLVGTRDGLLRFNTVTEKFTNLRTRYGRGYQVKNLYKDRRNNIWLSTTNGLRIISRQGTMKEYFHSHTDPESINGNNISAVIPYKDGNYLVAIDGGGIDYFDIKTQTFKHYTDENESQLSSNNITSIYLDSKGDLWAGTFLNGINFSNETTNLFVLLKNNPHSGKTIKKGIITCFLKDKNETLWISTDGGGLYRKDSGSDTFVHYPTGDNGLMSNSLISLLEDDNGFIWITSYNGGLTRLDPQHDTFKIYTNDPSNPNSLANDKVKAMIMHHGKIWITTYGTGISVLDTKIEKFRHYRYDKFYPPSIPSDWVQSMYIDQDDTLWLGTFKGLCKYNPATNTFKTYSFKDSFNGSEEINHIIDITEDAQGILWLGTDEGLIAFNKTDGSYKIFTMKDGISSNAIKSVIQDDHNNLWLSTNNGVTRFNLNTHKAKAYTIKDGVPPCSFFMNAKYKDRTGRIYFGSNDGYLIIDPKMSVQNKIVPPVVITEFKIFNQPMHPGQNDSPLDYHISATRNLMLSYDQNSLTFEFASLNFNNSQNNHYAYMLEGFDEDWVIANNQRIATYTNLNPGIYTFRVRGSNNDNVWNEQGAFITITITPPFYKTWWFYTLSAAFTLLLLYFLYTWRINRIRNKNVLLEETVKQRTSELKAANEQLETFVYKASHDIKGPLRSVIGLTTIGQKDVKDEVALTYFDHILKSTKKLDTLLRDLLEVTKVKQATLQMEKINFKELVSEALANFENLSGFSKIKFSVEVKESAEFYSDRKMVYSIIQNLIENPIKYADFSKPECILTIQITVSEKGADLMFRDNGIGIPDEFQKKVFEMFFKVNDGSNGTGLGLYIVKSTVEKLNGTVQLESEKGKGSTFIIKL